MFDEYAAPFQFQNPKKIPAAPMITFQDVSVGYGDKVVLRHITNRRQGESAGNLDRHFAIDLRLGRRPSDRTWCLLCLDYDR